MNYKNGIVIVILCIIALYGCDNSESCSDIQDEYRAKYGHPDSSRCFRSYGSSTNGCWTCVNWYGCVGKAVFTTQCGGDKCKVSIYNYTATGGCNTSCWDFCDLYDSYGNIDRSLPSQPNPNVDLTGLELDDQDVCTEVIYTQPLHCDRSECDMYPDNEGISECIPPLPLPEPEPELYQYTCTYDWGDVFVVSEEGQECDCLPAEAFEYEKEQLDDVNCCDYPCSTHPCDEPRVCIDRYYSPYDLIEKEIIMSSCGEMTVIPSILVPVSIRLDSLSDMCVQ